MIKVIIVKFCFQSKFQKQVSRCLSAWMDWAIYPPDFLINLQAIFLGQPGSNTGLFGVSIIKTVVVFTLKPHRKRIHAAQVVYKTI